MRYQAQQNKWQIEGKSVVDEKQIGFAGASAGGHLTAHVTTSYQQRAYQSVDAVDEVSSRPDFTGKVI